MARSSSSARLGDVLPYSNPEFDEGKKKLTVNLEHVRAIAKTKKVKDNTVSKWPEKAEKLLDEAKKIEKMTDGGKRKIEEDKLLGEIKKLSTICEFGPFPQPFLVLDHFFPEHFERFEPIKEALYQLLPALRENSPHVIALYGEQGSGKTTLVEAVSKEARYLNLFEKVIRVKVSPETSIGGIQEQVADKLDMKFKNYTLAERANEMRAELKKRAGRALVILDNVRARIDLEGIGIPCDDDRCKVLLTVRRHTEPALNLYPKEIPLRLLSEEEALTFLKEHLRIDDASLKGIANECKGLPGAINRARSFFKGGKKIANMRALLDSLTHSMAQWDIFLSFRGPDTRYSFTGSLYDALCQEGFNTFMDDRELKGGDEIRPSLNKGIEASRLSIIVFSEKFAGSTWCLDEVVTILECKKTKKRILPIFYKVEPSDVRHQNNSYGDAMAEHENRYGKNSEKVKKWRKALFEVANLHGLPYKTGYEYKFIERIVDEAISKFENGEI